MGGVACQGLFCSRVKNGDGLCDDYSKKVLSIFANCWRLEIVHLKSKSVLLLCLDAKNFRIALYQTVFAFFFFGCVCGFVCTIYLYIRPFFQRKRKSIPAW